MPSIVHAFAPAKVNLALSVGAPDAAGMHPIASLMATCSFGDDLEVKRLLPDRFSRYSIDWHAEARRRTEIDWPIVKDLAVRAHLLLEERLGRRFPVQLKLEKRIPVGGGLGGGSSNGAAMLRAVDALFELNLRREFLEALARELGSDVPFLVRGGRAIVEGTGETLEPVDVTETHLVLVFPEIQCPTGAVYRSFDALRPDARLEPMRVRALAASQIAPHAPFNDLADAACAVAPALADAIAKVTAVAELPVHVSGSGSTLFVVCDSDVHAEALAGAIEMRAGMPAIATRTAAPAPEMLDGELRAAREHPVMTDED
ncbi:MAG: 4-(cytidine 5'-diphospho)-2-C-methyl-D-erythritol kinase [bacterium]